MQIPKLKSKTKMSMWSKFTRILIILNIFPIYRNNFGNIRFSWLSFRTCLFLIVSYFPLLFIFVCLLTQYEFGTEYIEKSTKIYVKFEILVILVSLTFVYLLSPLQILYLCKPFCKLQEISMDTSLSFVKKFDLLELIPANIISFGFTAFIYAHYMEVCKLIENSTFETCFTIVFMVPFFLIEYSIFFLAVAYYMVLVWFQNIEKIFQRKNVSNKIKWAEKCIMLYELLEQNMGTYFLVYFVQSQFIWIIVFFLAISLAISNSGFSMTSIIMHSLGSFVK